MIGENLKALRQRDNLTLASVAKAIHVSSAYLSRLENGHRPSLGVVERLAKFFSVPLTALFDDQFELTDMEAMRFQREFGQRLSSEQWLAMRVVAQAMLKSGDEQDQPGRY